MEKRKLVIVAFLGLVGSPCGCSSPQMAASKTHPCEIVARDVTDEDVPAIYAKYQPSPVLIATDAAAVVCPCEPRDLAGDTERRRLAGDTERRRLAGDTEDRDLAGDVEERRLAGDTEKRKLAGDVEDRRLAGETEERNLAGETEERDLAGETEERNLAGRTEKAVCYASPRCPGFIVHGARIDRVYNGEFHTLEDKSCIP